LYTVTGHTRQAAGTRRHASDLAGSFGPRTGGEDVARGDDGGLSGSSTGASIFNTRRTGRPSSLLSRADSRVPPGERARATSSTAACCTDVGGACG
jgi:hypothetical protein